MARELVKQGGKWYCPECHQSLGSLEAKQDMCYTQIGNYDIANDCHEWKDNINDNSRDIRYTCQHCGQEVLIPEEFTFNDTLKEI